MQFAEYTVINFIDIISSLAFEKDAFGLPN